MIFKNRIDSVLTLCCAFICGTLLVAGCGPAQVRTQQLIPENINIVKRQTGVVQLMVSGGHSEHAMQMPEISNEMFFAALEKAVAQSNLFQQVTNGDNGDFQISAHIFNLSASFWGRAPVSLEIAWQLFSKKDQTLLWKEDIVTSDEGFGVSGKEGYSKVGAIESAARKNISTALERMSALDIALPVK